MKMNDVRRSITINAELYRHLQKFACMKRTTVRAVLTEAIKQYTSFDSKQLAVKWVPRTPVATQQEIESIIGDEFRTVGASR
jgi:hypothetical protein